MDGYWTTVAVRDFGEIDLYIYVAINLKLRIGIYE